MAAHLDQRVHVKADRPWKRRIDEWRAKEPDFPSRSEAIRRLVDQAIAAAHATSPPEPASQF